MTDSGMQWARGLRARAAVTLAAALAQVVFATAADAQTACQGSVGPDLIVSLIDTPQNYPGADGYEAMSLGTTSCNMGDVAAQWDADTPNHPVIGQNLYRYWTVDGATRLEHVGRSWLKHGFATLNESQCCTCQPQGTQLLGVGCSDPYTAGRNGVQANLGPRWEINAHTGEFAYPPTQPPWSGTTIRRLEVAVSDLASAASGSFYFGEAQYVSRDDALAGNGNNNCTYRRISAEQFGNDWQFFTAGPNYVEQPAIRTWKRVDPSVVETDVQLPGEGFLVLSQDVTDLGTGLWHYEYALYNMNSDDGVGAFRVPIPPGVALSNVGFHDLDYRGGDGIGAVNFDGTDWPHELAGGVLAFATTPFAQNAHANALRWSSTMNFRFDADAPPTDGSIELGRFKSGLTASVAARVPAAPAPVGSTFCDGSGSACPCTAGAPGHGCQHSFGAGARLAAFGDPAANDVRLVTTDLPPRTTVVLLRSSTQDAGGGTPFGDGLVCVGSQKARVAAAIAREELLLQLDHQAGPGTFSFQVLFRNERPFCTASRFNLSNGIALTY
jgi:hypothetical protein